MDDVVHRDRLKAVRRERGKNEVMYLLPCEVLDAALGEAHVTQGSATGHGRSQ